MLPVSEPKIKLELRMKLIGNSTVSFISKFTLFLSELFWMPIKKIKNKKMLIENENINFLKGNNILF